MKSDGGSKFTSKFLEDLSALLDYKHLVVVPYRSQAKGLAERRMTEVMKHQRALVLEKSIKENWSHYLPLAQRIINYSVDRSIGTQPDRVIFWDMENGLAEKMGRNLIDYLVKLRGGRARQIKVTQEFLSKNQQKWSIDGGEKVNKVVEFHVGNYVMLQYPDRPPNKLAVLWLSWL